MKEEEEKQKEEEIKNRPKENPFLDHIGKTFIIKYYCIELCDQLIVYCEKLRPQ